MNELDRVKIIGSLKCVDEVFLSIDQDEAVTKSIEYLFNQRNTTIFAKGGDRNCSNIPEKAICDKLGIAIIDGLGSKIRSSSEIVRGI